MAVDAHEIRRLLDARPVERIAAAEGLSKNVLEMATRALAAEA